MSASGDGLSKEERLRDMLAVLLSSHGDSKASSSTCYEEEVGGEERRSK